MELNTNIGLQPAHAKVWEPNNPLALFITIDEGEARGEIITLRYWRETVDDLNMDGVADEDEYLSMQIVHGLAPVAQRDYLATGLSLVNSDE
jgi:hypothetical protein